MPSPGGLEPRHAVLTAAELARAGRFHFARDRDRFIAARAILRAILSGYLALAPQAVPIAYGPYGKPYLPASGLRFNLTHAGDLALYAFVRGHEVGVDLECARPGLDPADLARRFFSPREAAALLSLPSALRPQAFLACWARKEAYVKARGGGLSIPLDSFSVSLLPGEPAALLEPAGEAARWSLLALDPAPGYVACVAVEGKGWRVRRWQW
jgi:4'-phosphopantetheinyl transferase